MLKGRVIDDFSGMSFDDFVTRHKLVYNAMNGNKFFPAPDPTMDVFGAGVTALENAVLAAKAGGAVERAARDTQYDLALAQMKTLMEHVNYTAKGNREMLESSGFTVNAETRSTEKKLGEIAAPVAKPGKNTGEEQLSIKPVTNAVTHQFQVTTTPVTATSNWVLVPGNSRATAKNLLRGTEYAVRVFVKGVGEEFAYSAVVTFIAI